MSRGRRHQVNSINAAGLARWIAVTCILAVTGLVYVYLNLQLYSLGDQKKALENELVSLRHQNDDASVQVAALTSRTALQRRLKEGYLKLVPIAEESIVRLGTTPRHPGENDVQPVSNRHTQR